MHFILTNIIIYTKHVNKSVKIVEVETKNLFTKQINALQLLKLSNIGKRRTLRKVLQKNTYNCLISPELLYLKYIIRN